MMEFQILDYDVLTSTNDEAKRLALAGAAEGTVVRAAKQTAGRGRQGRRWLDERGACLMFSLLLRPPLAVAEASAWTLVVGIGVCRALSRLTDADVRVKWPNDIVASGQKLCGILAEQSAEENRVRHVVTGIGVNMNQTDFDEEIREKAVSMRLLVGHVFDADTVLAAILSELDALYSRFLEEGFTGLVEEYNALCVNVNADVCVRNARRSAADWEGIARGVDAAGNLLVETANGECVCVSSGEVSVRMADGRYA